MSEPFDLLFPFFLPSLLYCRVVWTKNKKWLKWYPSYLLRRNHWALLSLYYSLRCTETKKLLQSLYSHHSMIPTQRLRGLTRKQLERRSVLMRHSSVKWPNCYLFAFQAWCLERQHYWLLWLLFWLLVLGLTFGFLHSMGKFPWSGRAWHGHNLWVCLPELGWLGWAELNWVELSLSWNYFFQLPTIAKLSRPLYRATANHLYPRPYLNSVWWW